MSEIKVEEFVEQYNCLGSDAKIDFLKECVVKKYMDYLDKVAIAETVNILSSSNNETKMFEIKSSKKYVIYVMMIINGYTNIEVDFDNIYKEYDMLNKSGLIYLFMNQNLDSLEIIPKSELAECQMILDMTTNDFMINNTNTQNFISKLIGQTVETLADKLGNITPLIDEISNKLDSMDDEQKNKISDVIVNMFGGN